MALIESSISCEGKGRIAARCRFILFEMFCGRFKKKKKLGKGTYADVYLVEDQRGRELALKHIAVDRAEDPDLLQQYLDGEIASMKALHSAHLVRLEEAIREKENVYLLMQYCNGGNLEQYQQKMPSKATQILAQVIQGVIQIHENGYVHRDIKPNNILVHNQGTSEVFKVADFSFCKSEDDLNGSILGSPGAMPPQMFEDQPAYGKQVDVWAFGITFFLMLNDELPFSSSPAPHRHKRSDFDKRYLYLKAETEDFSFKKAVEKTKRKLMQNCSQNVQDLFKRIFSIDAAERITFDEIKQHPLFARYFPKIGFESKILSRAKDKLTRSLMLSSTIVRNLEGKKAKEKQQQGQGSKILMSSTIIWEKKPQKPSGSSRDRQRSKVGQRIAELKKERRQIDKGMSEALQAVSQATPAVIQEVLRYFKERAAQCQEELSKQQIVQFLMGSDS